MINLDHTISRLTRRFRFSLALLAWTSFVALLLYSSTAVAAAAETDRVSKSQAATGVAGQSAMSPKGLTLEDRIGYQRAIEEVYWRHRIWPKENLKPKPALDQVMPASVLQAKVEDDLRKSQALGVYWQRPITGEQLQAEMDRMARQTKQPEMLAELWAALGNDPFVIAECLARPALANRLIRSWYAYDERHHGELKRRAEGELRRYGTVSQMQKMSSEYGELEWVKGGSQEGSGPENRLSSEQWEAKVRDLARVFRAYPEIMWEASPDADKSGSRNPSHGIAGQAVSGAKQVSGVGLDLPVGELSWLQEAEDRFYVMAVLEKGDGRLKVATVGWKKEGFGGLDGH